MYKTKQIFVHPLPLLKRRRTQSIIKNARRNLLFVGEG
jgi:hypothetical protein